MPSSTSTKDPIQDNPLRDPGQSLREELLDQFLSRIIFWVLAAIIAFTLAICEWLHWLTNTRYMPAPVTLVAFVLGAIAVWRWITVTRQLAQWKLGLKGERAVGQFLQGTLLPLGYFVIHDVCGDDFNIDHVVIGPGGVFAIEVKTHSKPQRGGGTISYDGQRVLVDGFVPDRDPVVQAKAAARSLRKILEERTGHKLPVRSVVLFPGWWIERQPQGVETWVLNEKAFVKFIEREPTVLSPADSRVFAEGLARYVRDRVV